MKPLDWTLDIPLDLKQALVASLSCPNAAGAAKTVLLP